MEFLPQTPRIWDMDTALQRFFGNIQNGINCFLRKPRILGNTFLHTSSSQLEFPTGIRESLENTTKASTHPIQPHHFSRIKPFLGIPNSHWEYPRWDKLIFSIESSMSISWPGMCWEENPKNPRAGRDGAGKRPRNTTQFPGNSSSQIPWKSWESSSPENPTAEAGKGLDGNNTDSGIGIRIPSAWMEMTPWLLGLPRNFLGFLQAPVYGNSPYPRNPDPRWIPGMQDS